MPVSNTVTVTGSSASFDVTASGSGFGIFSSYSTYASQAFNYASSGAAVTGSGSFSLALDTSFGNLVFSGTDTIGASGSNYTFVGSETLSFVSGGDTLSFATGTINDAGSSLSGLSADLNNFYSSITSINSVVTLADSVSAAASADVASDVAVIVNAITPTVAGAAQITQQGVQFHFTKTS